MKYRQKESISSPFLENLLISRGITDTKDFLNPTPGNLLDPFLLDNIKEAAAELIKALNNNWKICIIQDCDQDGISSAAMLWNYLKEYKEDCQLSYKIHTGKQHGLEDMVEELQNEEYQMVILPDSSSNDYDFHKQLKDNGIEIIVIDHHEAEYYSKDAIVVNNQLSKNYPNKALSGAGVVYKFLEVLDILLGLSNADHYLDLAAVGIIGDVMSIATLENRYIISEGLKNIRNEGLKEVINKQSFSIKDTDNITPTDVSFYITPLVNALIRVGSQNEKEIMFQAFTDGKRMVPKLSRGKVVPNAYESLAEQNARNCVNARSRQNRQKDKAIDQLDMKIIKNGLDENKIILVEVDEENINSNLTGLIAMSLVSKYNKPVLVGRANEEGFVKGSLRNVNKSELVDLRQFLLDSEYFEYAQGHASAAGFSIPEKNIANFINYANKELANIDFSEGVYDVDFIINKDSYSDLSELVLSLGAYPEIYGKDNEEPLIVVENLDLRDSDISVCGKNSDTVRFVIDGITYIQFKAEKLIEELKDKKVFSMTILGTPNINSWMGEESPQIMIKDYNLRDTTLDF